MSSGSSKVQRKPHTVSLLLHDKVALNTENLQEKIHLPNPPLLLPVPKNSKLNKQKKTQETESSDQINERTSACSSCAQHRKLPALQDRNEHTPRLPPRREKSDLHLSSRSRHHVLKPLGSSDLSNKTNSSFPDTSIHTEQI